MKFTANGSLKAGGKALSDQALRAVNNLLGLFQRVGLDIKTILALFDSLVTSILLYGADVWGLYDYSCIAKKRATKFLLKILGNPLSLLHKIFNDQINEEENILITNINTATSYLAFVIKSFIENLGFSVMW